MIIYYDSERNLCCPTDDNTYINFFYNPSNDIDIVWIEI